MFKTLIVLFILSLLSSCGQTKLEDELLDELGFCFAFDLKCGEEHDDRFLAELADGSYRTTDKQRCRFTINNGELID